jgi:uncharacterized protein YdeI (YjbR/CyaY-like superfamily)
MPAYIKEALEELRLMDAYSARPPYQRNDYLGWIARTKLEKTRHKRLSQMLEELANGDKYMNMDYRPKDTDTLE